MDEHLRTERILLLVRVNGTTSADPYDVAAWQIDGRPITEDELQLLGDVTVDEVIDAQTLRGLAAELRDVAG